MAAAASMFLWLVASCLLAFNLIRPAAGVAPNQTFVTDMTQFPFMAKLPPYSWPSTISCSATIITDRHIILAAHCLNATMRGAIQQLGLSKFHDLTDLMPGLKANAYFGVGDIRSPDAIIVPIKAVAFPPGYPFPGTPYVRYNPLLWLKDMAVAELANPLTFSAKVQPIKLAKRFPPVRAGDNREALIAGWGGEFPYQLAVGHVQLEPDQVCVNATYEYYNYWRNVANNGGPISQADLQATVQNMSIAMKSMVCASPKPSALEGGNGGGPLLVKANGEYYEVAVLENTLATTSDGFYQSPFVSADIDDECDWLEQLTGAKCVPMPQGHHGHGSHSHSHGH